MERADRRGAARRTGNGTGRGAFFPAGLANQLKYAGFALAAGIVPRLPGAVAYAAAAPAGRLAAAVTPRKRAVVVSNLAHVLGPQASRARLDALSWRVYESAARYYVDLLRSPALDTDTLRQAGVHVRGLEHLRRALGEDRGVIIVTIHFGCPEIVARAARAWGLEFVILTEPIEPPALRRLFLRLRSSHGHRVMTVGLTAIKAALRALRAGGVLVLLVDRDIQGTGVAVPFFGAPATMPAGAVELARATGAPILPVIAERLTDGRAQVTIEPPLELIATGSRTADLHANVARLLTRFEPYIRRAPEQWFVLTPTWKAHGARRRRRVGPAPPSAAKRVLQSAANCRRGTVHLARMLRRPARE